MVRRGPRERLRQVDRLRVRGAVLLAEPALYAREEGDLGRLFEEREGLYREFAAHVVDGSGSVEEVAAAIERELLRWNA